MKLGFEESQATFSSGSQRARVWTERWVADQMFCPNCGADRLSQFPANSPVADFFCPACSDQFEVKAKNGKTFGRSVADGAYDTKIARLTSKTNPNLLLIGYDKAARAVHSACIVPKHFFVPDIVQKRKPLADTARRAGWIGSNILLNLVPDAGRIFILRHGVEEPREAVLEKWRQTLFLREKSVETRGWLLEVMKSRGRDRSTRVRSERRLCLRSATERDLSKQQQRAPQDQATIAGATRQRVLGIPW